MVDVDNPVLSSAAVVFARDNGCEEGGNLLLSSVIFGLVEVAPFPVAVSTNRSATGSIAQ